MIEPAHEFRYHKPDKAGRSYTPDEIWKQQETLLALREEMDTLKDKIRQAKELLNEMVVRIEIPKADFREFIFTAYWHSGEITKSTLTRLVKERLGDAYRTWQTVIEGKLDWPCDDCGKVVPRTFTSKTALKDARTKSYKHFRCPECEQKHKREQETWILTSKSRHERQSERLVELRAMPYAEYLQTPEWEETRKAALKRAKYRCQVCNSNHTTLQVHHNNYENIGQERNVDLIVLCKGCHAKVHDKEPAA